MDLSLLIRDRLNELGLEQKDLALAAQVTESYVSQLLSRKKAPPAPGRTDLYDKMGDFLRLPKGELSTLADLQRREELKKKVADPPAPLFEECRNLILKKCDPPKRNEVLRIFEKQPFGELERLVTQKLLDVAQGTAREELRNEEWLRRMAPLSGRSYEQIRVAILEFLDTDVFNISVENCVSFLDPMIESWDVDLKTFAMQIALNRRLAPGRVKRFEFIEREPEELDTLRTGPGAFSQGPLLKRRHHGRGDLFSEKARFQGETPFPAVLLSRTAKSQGPSSLP